MNSPKKPQPTLWVLEEEGSALQAAKRPIAPATHATADFIMERLKLKARAYALRQKKRGQPAHAQMQNGIKAENTAPSTQEQNRVKAENTATEDLKWGVESVSVRITSQEGQAIND